MDTKKTNFLPDDEKKDLKDLQGSSNRLKPEIKLTVPEKEAGKEKDASKKDSFWQRRKRKKAMKEAEKLRRKGETGLVKEAKKEATSVEGSKETASTLFEDTPKKKESKKEIPPQLPKKQAESPSKQSDVSPKKEQPTSVMIEETRPMRKSMTVASETKKNEPGKPDEKKKKKTDSKLHQAGALNNFGGPNVNLVSGAADAESRSPNWLVAVIILVFTIAVWVVAGGIAVSRAKKAETQIQNDTAKLERVQTAIAALQGDKIIAQKIQKQFDSVESLIDGHLYWSPLLDSLEALTIPDVYYSRMNADLTSNVLAIEAVAKNYDAAARQIRSFELAPNVVSDVFVGEARIENQPGAVLPVPIVKVELQLTLAEGILSFDVPENL